MGFQLKYTRRKITIRIRPVTENIDREGKNRRNVFNKIRKKEIKAQEKIGKAKKNTGAYQI